VRDRFRAARLDTPELDARLLAELAFGVDQLTLFTRERQAAPEEGLERLQAFAARRLRGEPVVRIAGQKQFWGLDFALSEATLVPRPETELIVQQVLDALEGLEDPMFLDLGTGTGCIAIAVLSELPQARAIAVDLSAEALLTAQWNAQRHGVDNRVAFRRGSWFDPIENGEAFDVVVGNPPYIPREVIPTLAPEVRAFDPPLALDGGWDGVDAYRTIAGELVYFLRPGGTALFEIGHDQGWVVSKLFAAAGFGEVTVEADLAGLDRVVVVRHI